MAVAVAAVATVKKMVAEAVADIVTIKHLELSIDEYIWQVIYADNVR